MTGIDVGDGTWWNISHDKWKKGGLLGIVPKKWKTQVTSTWYISAY